MALRFIIKSEWGGFLKPFNLDFHPKMKSIQYAIINGEYHNKPQNRNSVKVQNYYNFLIDNKKHITELKTLNGNIYYLNNCKLHSYNGPCLFLPGRKNDNNRYALNGKILYEKDFIIFNRFTKVKKLIERI